MNITKRDGSVVPFERQKIIDAVNKAFLEVDGVLYEEDTSESCAAHVINYFSWAKVDPTVEQVQDMVEEYLMESERKDVARAYIRYRYKKEVARNYGDDFINEVIAKLSGKKNDYQNANVDEASFGGRVGEATRVLTKRLALDFAMSPLAKERHLNNQIYTHDLDSYYVGQHNCMSIPFDDLLANGFNTRQTDVRPANSINTAFQLVAVIFQLQSLQQFGGVSATHLDWTMVPYVRKSFYKHYKDGIDFWLDVESDFTKPEEEIREDLYNYIELAKEKNYGLDNEYFDFENPIYKYAIKQTGKELKQAAEGMFHNLCTLQSRSGNQLPFSSINYGTCAMLEGRMVTKAILEASISGVGKIHRTSIFPCQIFQCMKGINRKPGDPNYDLFLLALKSTSLRLYPNYANVDWSGNVGYDTNDPKTYFSTMGKRKL